MNSDDRHGVGAPQIDVRVPHIGPKRVLQFGWWAWEDHKAAEGYL